MQTVCKAQARGQGTEPNAIPMQLPWHDMLNVVYMMNNMLRRCPGWTNASFEPKACDSQIISYLLALVRRQIPHANCLVTAACENCRAILVPRRA